MTEQFKVSTSKVNTGFCPPPIFLNKLRLESLEGGYKFILINDFTMEFSWDLEKNIVVRKGDIQVRKYVTVSLTACSGFETDLISSPRFLWSLFPPAGSGLMSSVIHDLLYRNDVPSPDGKYFDQKAADKIFRAGLDIEENVSVCKKVAMYTALKLAGIRAWKENRK
jgi:hypothetical protein